MGRKYGDMDQVPNPQAPPQTAIPFSQYLITYFPPENVLIQKQLYHLVLLLDFHPTVNSVIPQKLGDGLITPIFIFILQQYDNH